MSSQAQTKANRKNAQKSTGPRTPEGKETSSQNAIKHGLRATRDVIKTENQDDFVLFRDEMLADISPDGAMEEMLAERIVSLSWRLKRAEHFQNAVVDALIEHGLHGASSGFGWTSENRERATKEAAAGDVDVMLGIVINHDFANSKTLDMLLSYERRIESSLYRAIAELKKMRHMRKERDDGVAGASSPCMHGQDAHATLLETASEIHDCTNEANSLMTETAFPLGTPYGGAEVHPTNTSSLCMYGQDAHATNAGTNEAKLESGARHPYHEDFIMMGMTPVTKGE